MAVEQNKVMMGVGTLYYALYGEAFPAKTGATITPGANWKDVGATKGGAVLETTTEYTPSEIDQALSPIGKNISAQRGQIKVTMAQSDIEKLMLAIPNSVSATTAAGAGQVGIKTMKVGPTTAHKVYSMIFVTKSPESPVNSSWWRMFSFWRVTAGGTVGLAYKKGEMTVVDVVFDVEEDTTKTADEALYRLDDMSALATS